MTNTDATGTTHEPAPHFRWVAGGWFGAQCGSTLWLLPLGIGALPHDRISGVVAFSGFVVANGLGLLLWSARRRLSAFVGLQLLLAVMLVVFTTVIVVTNARCATELPYWPAGLPLLLMAFFWLRTRERH